MFRRLLIVAFFGLIYSPIVLGIPRYDFFGLLTATFYSWCWIVHIIVRDYACIYYSETVALKVPEYLTWQNALSKYLNFQISHEALLLFIPRAARIHFHIF